MKTKTKPFLLFGILLFILVVTCENDEKIRLSKVTIGSTSNITETTATVAGEILDVSDKATDYGHCWSTNSMPTIGTNNYIDKGGTVVKGKFTTLITGLDINTKYYVRAYVKEGKAVVYSEGDVDFTTGTYQLPTVSTDAVTIYSHNTATLGGEVKDDGGDKVTDRGVCYGKFPNPAITNSIYESNGVGTGKFSSNVSGLKHNTKYYVRAYATNSIGTAYGPEERSFTTKEEPFITVTSPSGNSHWGGGMIHTITWNDNISEKVTIKLMEGNSVKDDITGGVGVFSDGSFDWGIPASINSGTNYYIKITSVDNTSLYGKSSQFEIAKPPQDYEGHVYQIVKIGGQWWMSQNLKSTKYADGIIIPLIEGNTNWSQLSTDNIAYCNYDDKISYSDDYGVLYTWVTAMKGIYIEETQGVCPDGWHIPSDSEWMELEKTLGMSENVANEPGWRGNMEGNLLKEEGVLHWNSANGTNHSGFTGVGSGFRNDLGTSSGLKTYASYWVSNYNGTNAWYRQLHADVGKINRDLVSKLNGFSVRCIKN